MPIKSPVRSSAGPEVVVIFDPMAWAMMCASVVLPSPGGPWNNACSSGSERRRAASSAISSFSTTFFCPIYSASVGGRRVWLKLSSSFEMMSGETSRSLDMANSYEL